MERANYTPDQLAERWECSANTVRNMIKDKKLPAFKLGGRVYRIPAKAVEEHEKCLSENTGSNSSGESGASSGEKEERNIGVRLARMTKA